MQRILHFALSTMLVWLIFCGQLFGQDDIKDPSQLGSLVRVPDTTGFYMATMNHKAIFDTVFESRAWKAIRKSKVSRNMKRAYRRGRSAGYDEYGFNAYAIYLKSYGDYYDNMMAQSVLKVIEPLFENEMFIYVDNNATPFLRAISHTFENSPRLVELNGLGQSVADDAKTEELDKFFEEAFAEVECPTVLVGCRVSDRDYRGMIELARTFVDTAIDNLSPERASAIKDAFEVIDNENEFVMTLNMHSLDDPVESLLGGVENNQLGKSLTKAVKGKGFTFALGIKDDIVFFGMANDVKTLLEFGSTERKMIDLPELSKLRTAIDNNFAITSVNYTSKQYAQNALRFDRLFKSMLGEIAEGIERELKNNELLKKEQFSKDDFLASGNELFAELETMFPEPSMAFGFSHLSDRGIECFSRLNSTYPTMDGSSPLSLTECVSEDTIAFSLCRFADCEKIFRFVAKCFSSLGPSMTDSTANGLKEAIARAELQSKGVDRMWVYDFELSEKELIMLREARSNAEENHEAIVQFSSEFFIEVNKIMDEKILPALKGGESGVLVDLVTGPNPLHESWAKTKEPLRLPSILMVQQHNDKQSLEAGYDEMISKMEKLLDEYGPNFGNATVVESRKKDLEKFARTESEAGSFAFGEVFPPEFKTGFDPSIVTAWFVCEDKLFFNFPGKTIERLAKKRPNRIFGPAAESTKRPSTSASFYDHRLAMKMVNQWMESSQLYGQYTEPAKNGDGETERNLLDFTTEEVKEHFDRIWSFAGCWKGYSSRSYEESGGTVTQTLYRFEDIPAGK